MKLILILLASVSLASAGDRFMSLQEAQESFRAAMAKSDRELAAKEAANAAESRAQALESRIQALESQAAQAALEASLSK